MDLNDLLHSQQVERIWADHAKSLEAQHAHAELARKFEHQIEIATAGRMIFSRQPKS